MGAETFGYLASISAVLCGFGFSFLGLLFVLGKPSRAIDWTTGFSAIAAACLLVCALGWTMLAAMPGDFSPEMNSQNQVFSLAFILGVVVMLLALGTSGWIRSRAMGVFTSCAAFLALLGAMFALAPFVN